MQSFVYNFTAESCEAVPDLAEGEIRSLLDQSTGPSGQGPLDFDPVGTYGTLWF